MARLLIDWRNSFGVERLRGNVTQGSSLLATLGFVAESRWDSFVQAACRAASKVQCPPPLLRGRDKTTKFNLPIRLAIPSAL